MAPQTTDRFLERNRFVAFAFAAADAFLEVDSSETITFADGATHWLTGQSSANLVGRALRDFVADGDQSLVRAALAAPLDQGRLGPLAVSFARPDGGAVRAEMSGMRLPGTKDKVFLSLAAPRLGAAADRPDASKRDEKTGLLTKQGFTNIATRALQGESASGQPHDMTLFDLGGLDALEKRLGSEAAGALLHDIASHLRASSLDGASAGRIEAETFGVVHAANLDIAALTDTIGARARDAAGGGEGLTTTAATIELESGALSDADNAKALLYTITKFSEDHGNFTITELSGGYHQMLDQTRRDIIVFKNIIATNGFDAVYQPIVSLADRECHHYEALARLHDRGEDSSPFKFITFAEEVGIIGDFNLAMTRKVIDTVQMAYDNGDHLSIAVNLSTRSLETPAVVDALHVMLKGCGAIREQLLFEVTESWRINDLEAVNRVLGSLRDLGHAICLDDFGAGASAFQYLRALDVDYVKIDGVYIREAFTEPNGTAYLKSLANLCRDLGIETVGEMVETEREAELLKQIGVTYGQGYLFGKPAPGVSSLGKATRRAR